MHDFTLYSHEVKHFAFGIIYNITMKHCLSMCGWDSIYAEFTVPHYRIEIKGVNNYVHQLGEVSTDFDARPRISQSIPQLEPNSYCILLHTHFKFS